MILFNTGVMVAKPVGGNEGANPTPLALGILQEGQIEVSWDLKSLYGQAQFPVDVATGKGKVSGTAKYASVTGKLISDIFFGQGVSTGANVPAYLEAHSIPGTPFQITITPPSGTFLEDLGVNYSATGVALTKVASGPITGQYSVNEGTGVYTFASADTTLGVQITYLYTVTTGFKSVIANQLMGFGPNFELDFWITYNNQTTLVKCYSCKMTKWGLPSKQGDYTIQDVSFEAFANAAGNVFELDYTS